MSTLPVPSFEAMRTAIAWVWCLLVAAVLVPGMHAYLSGGAAQASGLLGLAALGVASAPSFGHLLKRPARQIGLATALLAVAGALALGPEPAVSGPALGVLLPLGLLSFGLSGRMRAAIPGPPSPWSPYRRFGIAVALCLGLFGSLATTRIGIFMEDPLRADACVVPPLADHSCLTAYAYAGELSRQGVANLYDAALYPAPWGSPGATSEIVPEYAPFVLDAYAYPPQFLLLPRLLLPLAPDFTHLRALWYSLTSLVSLFALWRTARWVGPPELLALSPLVWLSFPVFGTSMTGNVHPLTMGMAILAMVAFARQRRAVGGALLSFAILSKISPGLLGIYLLARKEWAAAAWTAGFGLLWSALALALMGPDPFVAFLTYELPRLSSGAALKFLAEYGPNLAINQGPFGLPFKAQALGVGLEVDPWAAGKLLSNLWTLAAALCAIVSARRGGSHLAQATAWMAILTMAALRSPHAPTYAFLPAIWALTLLLSYAKGPRALGLGILLWVSFSSQLYFLPLKAYIFTSLIGQGVVYAFVVWLLLRGPDRSGAFETPPAGSTGAEGVG